MGFNDVLFDWIGFDRYDLLSFVIPVDVVKSRFKQVSKSTVYEATNACVTSECRRISCCFYPPGNMSVFTG